MAISRLFAVLTGLALCEAGCEPSACTPDDQGFGDAQRLAIRPLDKRSSSVACASPRVEVLASEEELRRLFDLLGPNTDGGAGPPAVDFARERVIVRESPSGESMSWAVAEGETATVGVLACVRPPQTPPSCLVEIIAVPSIVTRVDAKRCTAVACGGRP